MNKPILSIVSPVYRASEIVDLLVDQIFEVANKITPDFEIVLVEDGSPDNSWSAIERNCKKDSRIKGVKLSRNFGQHKAITAGLATAVGEYVVVMDCDLQDNPIYIEELYNKARSGYDIVFTVKSSREHNFLKNITARLFNTLFNFLIDYKPLKTDGQIGAYSILSRKVVNEFIRFGDFRRHYLMVVRWLGFDSGYIHIKHEKRKSGRSSYNLSKLINHAVDGITSQSDKVLLLTVYAGFTLALCSFIGIIAIIVSYFLIGFQSGWASLSVLILFFSGVIITTIGIVGVYVGRTFEQSKGRQLFIIDKTINL